MVVEKPKNQSPQKRHKKGIPPHRRYHDTRKPKTRRTQKKRQKQTAKQFFHEDASLVFATKGTNVLRLGSKNHTKTTHETKKIKKNKKVRPKAKRKRLRMETREGLGRYFV